MHQVCINWYVYCLIVTADTLDIEFTKVFVQETQDDSSKMDLPNDTVNESQQVSMYDYAKDPSEEEESPKDVEDTPEEQDEEPEKLPMEQYMQVSEDFNEVLSTEQPHEDKIPSQDDTSNNEDINDILDVLEESEEEN